MIDVYFEGYGYWACSNKMSTWHTGIPLTETCYTSGVFCLVPKDEVQYKLTEGLENVIRLLPNYSHPDSPFLSLDLQSYATTKIDIKDVRFVIDLNMSSKLPILTVIPQVEENIETDNIPSVSTQVHELTDDNNCEESGNQNKKKIRRQTQINIFLTELCQKQNIDTLNAESLVNAIKPLVGRFNCPVEKFHGFYDEVCVEWKPGTGSSQGTWGKKTFHNFVYEFKKSTSKKPVK